MAFFPPIPLIRKRVIMERLQACGAVSEQTAKSLAEAGVLNPDWFRRITERLVKAGCIHRTADGRYYV
jgi:predicted transcriptional regulator